MKRIQISLKTKLLLFSMAILLIPWIGYKYVRGMESFLKTSLEESLATKARAIASVLQQRPELFDSQQYVLELENTDHLYLRTIQHPMQLDGYADDWQHDLDLFRLYDKKNIISQIQPEKTSLHFQHAAGRYGNYLYAYFKVNDDRIIYHSPGQAHLGNSDHLRISLVSPSGKFQRYFLVTEAPGRAAAKLMPENPANNEAVRPEHLIQAVWQETAAGYSIEIRIPLSMIGNKLGFSIADIDDPANSNPLIIGTSNTNNINGLATIKVPSGKLDQLLQDLNRSPSRIWVIDNNRRVLALSGSLNSSSSVDYSDRSIPAMVISSLYRLILTQPVTRFEDMLSGASKLQGREIDSALNGKATTSWRATPSEDVTILTTTQPLYINHELKGAIMLEQNSNRILLLQNQAMEDLFNLSIPVILGGTLLVILFATRLTSRIRKLRNQTEAAISADGRINKAFIASPAGDEIGDLSRSFADLLDRLQQYNRYLETMASKLSHELRTPMTVVRSSLDNLEQTSPATADDTYMVRAREGLERLNNILNRLSEASRLEQALQSTEMENINLGELLSGCIEGYRLAYPDNRFELDTPDEALMLQCAPDLIVQMLDKLISNAVDFSEIQHPVLLSAKQDKNQVQIRISNQGPLLPAEMEKNLFESLISVRKEKSDTPHLGLGLYIVRLIVEHHQGTISARNLEQPTGVEFSVTLPI